MSLKKDDPKMYEFVRKRIFEEEVHAKTVMHQVDRDINDLKKSIDIVNEVIRTEKDRLRRMSTLLMASGSLFLITGVLLLFVLESEELGKLAVGLCVAGAGSIYKGNTYRKYKSIGT